MGKILLVEEINIGGRNYGPAGPGGQTQVRELPLGISLNEFILHGDFRFGQNVQSQSFFPKDIILSQPRN